MGEYKLVKRAADYALYKREKGKMVASIGEPRWIKKGDGFVPFNAYFNSKSLTGAGQITFKDDEDHIAVETSDVVGKLYADRLEYFALGESKPRAVETIKLELDGKPVGLPSLNGCEYTIFNTTGEGTDSLSPTYKTSEKPGVEITCKYPVSKSSLEIKYSFGAGKSLLHDFSSGKLDAKTVKLSIIWEFPEEVDQALLLKECGVETIALSDEKTKRANKRTTKGQGFIRGKAGPVDFNEISGITILRNGKVVINEVTTRSVGLTSFIVYKKGLVREHEYSNPPKIVNPSAATKTITMPNIDAYVIEGDCTVWNGSAYTRCITKLPNPGGKWRAFYEWPLPTDIPASAQVYEVHAKFDVPVGHGPNSSLDYVAITGAPQPSTTSNGCSVYDRISTSAVYVSNNTQAANANSTPEITLGNTLNSPACVDLRSALNGNRWFAVGTRFYQEGISGPPSGSEWKCEVDATEAGREANPRPRLIVYW